MTSPQSQQFEIQVAKGSEDLSDDDFQNVDEYEEGDANLHKVDNGRQLTKTQHNVGLDSLQNYAGPKQNILQEANLPSVLTRKNKKTNDLAGNLLKNYKMQISRPPKVMTGSKGAGAVFKGKNASTNDSMLVSNFNLNQSDMVSGDARNATSRYIPRQKSKTRIANTQVGQTIATTMMNLSRNDESNMSRMQIGDVTELDGFTKHEDQSQMNLTTMNQYEGEQNQFTIQNRRKSQPMMQRTTTGYQLWQATKLQQITILEKVPSKINQRGSSSNLHGRASNQNSVLQSNIQGIIQSSIKYIPPSRQVNASYMQQQAPGASNSLNHNASSKSLDFGKAYEKLVEELSTKQGGARLFVPEQDLIIKETMEVLGKPILNMDQRSKSIAELQRKKKEKINQAQQHKLQEEMRECTFRPKLKVFEQRKASHQAHLRNNSSQNGILAQVGPDSKGINTSRGIDEFLSDQNKFLEAKRKKQDLKRTQEEDEIKRNLMSKKINKKSIDLLKKRQERLGSQNPKDRDNQQADSTDNMDSHQSGNLREKTGIQTLSISISTKNLRQQAIKTKKSISRPGSKLSDKRQNLKNPQRSQTPTQTSGLTNRNKIKSSKSPNRRQDADKVQSVYNQVSSNNKKLQSLLPQSSYKKSASKNSSVEVTKGRGGYRLQSVEKNTERQTSQIDKYLLNNFNKKFNKAMENLQLSKLKSSEHKSDSRSPVALRKSQVKNSDENQQMNIINQTSPTNLFKGNFQDVDETPKGQALEKTQVRELFIALDLLSPRINIHIQKKNDEDELFQELWRQLRPSNFRTSDLQYEVVYSENLRFILQVILKMSNTKRICEPFEGSIIEWKASSFQNRMVEPTETSVMLQKPEMHEQNLFGFTDRLGLLYLKPTEVAAIQQMFEQFNINRISYHKDETDKKRAQIEQKISVMFNPQISKKSIIMGQERKRKIARQIGIDERDLDKMTDPKNYLPLLKKYEQQQRDEQAKKAQDEDFKKKYTFAPDTKLTKGKVKPKQYQANKNIQDERMTTIHSIKQLGINAKRPSESDSKREQSNPRYNELYNLRKRIIDQRDKSRDELDFEKGHIECTFRPQIIETTSSQNKPKKKGIDSQTNQDQNSRRGQESGRAPPTINIFVNRKAGNPLSATVTQRSILSEQKSLERLQRGRQDRLKKEQILKIGERVSSKNQKANQSRQQVPSVQPHHEYEQQHQIVSQFHLNGDQMEDQIGNGPFSQNLNDNSTIIGQQSINQNSSDQHNSPIVTNSNTLNNILQNQVATTTPSEKPFQNPLQNQEYTGNQSTSKIIAPHLAQSESNSSPTDKKSHISEPPIAMNSGPEVGISVSALMASDSERKEVYVEDQEEIINRNQEEVQGIPSQKNIVMDLQKDQGEDQVELRDFAQVKVDGAIGNGHEETAKPNQEKEEIHYQEEENHQNDPEIQQIKEKISKVQEYRDNEASAVQIDDDMDYDNDEVESDDDARGVPYAKQSDIKEAIESNMSRANQFSSHHKSMALGDIDDHMSNIKSNQRRVETEIIDKHQQNSITATSLQNQTVTQQAKEHIQKESPYKDVHGSLANNSAVRRNSGSGNGSARSNRVRDEAIESPSRLSKQQPSSNDASSVAPLLFVDVNLGPEQQERIVIYDGDTPTQLAIQFCKQHDLDDEMQEQLTILLQQQMATILPKVVEEEYNQEDTEENDYEKKSDNDEITPEKSD